MKDLKIVFMGSDSFVVPVLKKLQENFEVVGVVTAPNSAIAQYVGTKILVFTPEKLDDEFHSVLLTLNSDLIVVSSYGKIIPQEILDIPKFGALNVHPSLLPKYRGASPVPAAILAGDSKTGVTIIKMDEKMDHGPILITKSFSLTGKEILPELINFLFQEGAKLLVTIIPDFASGKLKPKPQDHTKATFCKLLRKEDGFIDINTPPSPEDLDRMTKAYFPWPGVWTTWNGKIVKFLPSSSHPELDSGSRQFVVQMEGKKVTTFKDFLNGYPGFPLKALASQ